MKAKSTILIFPLAVLVCSFGCIKRPAVVYDQPEVAQSGHYEKAWIDPQIIFSDTLYTLIRSDRIDSFYVDQPPDPDEELASAISFQIYNNC